MVNHVILEGSDKCIIERGIYEKVRAVENVAFMIDRHIKDKDASYLDSLLHQGLVERAHEAFAEAEYFATRILKNVLGSSIENRSVTIEVKPFSDLCYFSISGSKPINR